MYLAMFALHVGRNFKFIRKTNKPIRNADILKLPNRMLIQNWKMQVIRCPAMLYGAEFFMLLSSVNNEFVFENKENKIKHVPANNLIFN